ncbi:MAG TPA: hypothetical protein VFV12_10560 [Xanthobacteraceae bacterium]|nr:hypothetical protein [Xanthobacteraceae bacterium]
MARTLGLRKGGRAWSRQLPTDLAGNFASAGRRPPRERRKDTALADEVELLKRLLQE